MKPIKTYEIEKLYDLKKKGVITNAEFEKQKKELLESDNSAQTSVSIIWSDVFISYLLSLLCFIPCAAFSEDMSDEAAGCVLLITLFISNIISSIIANSRR